MSEVKSYPLDQPPPESHVKAAVDFLKAHKGIADNSDVGALMIAKHARYGIVNRFNGSAQELGWYPCHTYMSEGKNASVSFSQVMRTTKPGFEESTEAYFDWILGPESPWKEALPETPFVLSDGLDVNSREFMLTYGFVFWNIHVLPSNVQHQFLVASRMPKEWPDLIKSWFGLVKQGFTREFAFAFITLWHQDHFIDFPGNGKEFESASVNFYDFPLDMKTCDEAYVLNFLSRKMVGQRNPPYAVSPKYDPVNSLWGKNAIFTGNLDKDQYSKQFFERYNDLGVEKTVKKITLSGILEIKSVVFDSQTIIKIGLIEQARLYDLQRSKR